MLAIFVEAHDGLCDSGSLCDGSYQANMNNTLPS